MSLRFQRKIGAAADIKELEYMIALHQTTARQTATISSVDVHRFLRSRYALSPKAVSQNRIAELLLSLGGGEDVIMSSRAENANSNTQPGVQNSAPESSSPKLPESSPLASEEEDDILVTETSTVVARDDVDSATAAANDENNVTAKDITLDRIETPPRVQNSTIEESSPKLPRSSPLASDDNDGILETETITVVAGDDDDDDAVTKDDEKNVTANNDALDPIETAAESIQQYDLDEEIHATLDILQEEMPNILHCQLE